MPISRHFLRREGGGVFQLFGFELVRRAKTRKYDARHRRITGRRIKNGHFAGLALKVEQRR